jgi:PadR family transcriptional regulator, regulatory protein AphA
VPRALDHQPTATSYALLGMLAIRPWTTYELAKAMAPTRGVGRLWPRARSHIYAEPKRLLALGLAEATVETVGRRRRTVYVITPAGRRALRAWLAAPSAPGPAIVMESEHLLKLFYADHGTRDDLLATLTDLKKWAESDLAEHSAVARSYLLGEGDFQERAPVLAIGGKLLFDLTLAVEQWADWALQLVQGWPEDPSQAPTEWTAFETVAQHLPSRPATVASGGRSLRQKR